MSKKSVIHFVVLRSSNKQFRWRAHTGSPHGKIVGNNAEFHKRPGYTVQKAKDMAAGRPVWFKNWKSGLLLRVQ